MTEVKKLIPGLEVTYDPCPVRSAIADSWPRKLDDKNAMKDWGWEYQTNMYSLAKKILTNIDPEFKKGVLLNLEDDLAGSSSKQSQQAHS